MIFDDLFLAFYKPCVIRWNILVGFPFSELRISGPLTTNIIKMARYGCRAKIIADIHAMRCKIWQSWKVGIKNTCWKTHAKRAVCGFNKSAKCESSITYAAPRRIRIIVQSIRKKQWIPISYSVIYCRWLKLASPPG